MDEKDSPSVDLQNLLDRAARLKRRIDVRNENTRELVKRLENLKTQIAVIVPNHPSAAGAASNTKGGGTSWTLGAATGATVRVTQPAARLISKISDSDLIAKLRNLCGKTFNKLFVVQYNCQKDFRSLCYQLLPDKDTARDVIDLCEETSKPTVTIS